MSFIGNIFGNSAPAPAPAGTPGPAPSPTTPANTDAFNPNHTTDPQNKSTPVAPLAEFGDLFTVPKDGEAKPEEAFAWNYDKETLAATVGNMSFVDPAQMGEVATALGVQNPEALGKFMNEFGRNLYMQSLLVNSKMSEQTVNIAEQRFSAKVPDHIRNSLVSNEVTALDPNAQNPALAPIVNMVAAQIRQKNPNMSPEQVATHTKAYMDQVAQVYTPQPKTTSNNPSGAPADFTTFFTQRS